MAVPDGRQAGSRPSSELRRLVEMQRPMLLLPAGRVGPWPRRRHQHRLVDQRRRRAGHRRRPRADRRLSPRPAEYDVLVVVDGADEGLGRVVRQRRVIGPGEERDGIETVATMIVVDGAAKVRRSAVGIVDRIGRREAVGRQTGFRSGPRDRKKTARWSSALLGV